ncbi:MAG: ABC transporter ATP-binding protein [Clostridia bacterium]|nr:ABC transporter ATP-binding protein [Clostridia bacterium]
MEILKIENLSKCYGKNDNKIQVLYNMSFSIKRGEFVSIVGASGSGKSTLLHIIGGIDKADSGTVIVDGQSIQGLSDKELAKYRRNSASLVFQFYNLIPILTVKENISLPTILDGKEVNDKKLTEIINILGLKGKEENLPNQLSGGEQQRASIGRALFNNAKILLADEPTGNLDSHNSEEVIKLLKEYNAKYGQTIIIVTHNIDIAKQTDRIITIQDGRIIKDEVQ